VKLSNTLKDGDQIVFERETMLPLTRDKIECAIDEYIIKQRKIKLEQLEKYSRKT